jgi:hypothetical protein
LEELVEAFDLNRVHKAAKIDPEKKQINHQHLIKQKDEDWRIPSLLSLLQKKLRYQNVLIKLFLIKEKSSFCI